MEILFLDPSLKSLTGHCANYAACLRREAERRSIPLRMFGSRDMTLPEKPAVLAAYPTFAYDADGRPSTLQSVIGCFSLRLYNGLSLSQHGKGMQRDIDDLFAQHDVSGESVLVFNSMRSWQVLATLKALAPYARRVKSICFILHFTSEPQPGKRELRDCYPQVFAMAQTNDFRGRTYFLADSQGLVDEFISRGCPKTLIDLCPIPHVGFDFPASQSGRVTVGAIGEQRPNKGFEAIPDAIARCKRRSGAPERCHFLVHSHRPSNESSYVEENFEKLKRLHVELCSHALDENAYYSFLNRLDIVLLPYTTDHYHVQTSGIFAEALSIGKIVIASRGTWMEREMDAFDTGRTCEPADGESLADAIESVLTNFPTEKARAANAAARWRQFHNPSILLDKILSHPESRSGF